MADRVVAATVREALVPLVGNDRGRGNGRLLPPRPSRRRLARFCSAQAVVARWVTVTFPDSTWGRPRASGARRPLYRYKYPRTFSSSTRPAQSVASRLVRKVLMVAGQPRLRMMPFHVPAGVLTKVAVVSLRVPHGYRRCKRLLVSSRSLTVTNCFYGGPCRDRTCDPRIKSPVLYQLS